MVVFSKLNQRKTNTECSLVCGSHVTDTKTHVCICDVKGGRGKREGRKGRAKYIIYSHGSACEMWWCAHRILINSSCPDTVSNEQTVRTRCLCKWIGGLDLLPIPT